MLIKEQTFTNMSDSEIAQDFEKAKKHYYKKGNKILSNSILSLQKRYDKVALNENATSEDWQEFYLSIEKLIMKQACFNNFKRYINKDSELWSYLITNLLDQIIPKKNIDGTRSCWYIDKKTNRIYKGYDPKKSNIGNFILNRIKFLIMNYNNTKEFEIESLVDSEENPIVDNFEFPELQKSIDKKEQINVLGNSTEYMKKVSSIMKFHNFAVLSC